MKNEDLQKFSDELIIDAFLDNKVNLLLMDEVNDQVLFKLYSHTSKVLQIECEIRDIQISKLIKQAETLTLLRNPYLKRI